MYIRNLRQFLDRIPQLFLAHPFHTPLLSLGTKLVNECKLIFKEATLFIVNQYYLQLNTFYTVPAVFWNFQLLYRPFRISLSLSFSLPPPSPSYLLTIFNYITFHVALFVNVERRIRKINRHKFENRLYPKTRIHVEWIALENYDQNYISGKPASCMMLPKTQSWDSAETSAHTDVDRVPA